MALNEIMETVLLAQNQGNQKIAVFDALENDKTESDFRANSEAVLCQNHLIDSALESN